MKKKCIMLMALCSLLGCFVLPVKAHADSYKAHGNPISNLEHKVRKCEFGLLFDAKQLTCNYAIVVNPS